MQKSHQLLHSYNSSYQVCYNVFYRSVFYCMALCCVVLYCIVMCCIVLHCIMLFGAHRIDLVDTKSLLRKLHGVIALNAHFCSLKTYFLEYLHQIGRTRTGSGTTKNILRVINDHGRFLELENFSRKLIYWTTIKKELILTREGKINQDYETSCF